METGKQLVTAFIVQYASPPFIGVFTKLRGASMVSANAQRSLYQQC